MRAIKMLGLAVIAATAMMAFLGAGSASAGTVLCKEHETEEGKAWCPEEARYPEGTYLQASSSEVVFENASGPYLTCTAEGKYDPASKIQFQLGATEGTPLPVKFEIMTFRNCHHKEGPNCTFSGVTLPSGEIEWTSGFDGTLSSGFPQVKLICGIFPFQCEISDKSEVEFEFHGTGLEGEPATLVATAQPLLTEYSYWSSDCASQYVFSTKEPKFTATYTIETPAPIYVSQHWE